MEDQTTRHYYVDEARDGTIFSTKGRVIIGTEGVSRYFILGLLDHDVASIHNLFHLYRPLADSWIIFDNSEELPGVIAKETAGALTVVDDKRFERIKVEAGII